LLGGPNLEAILIQSEVFNSKRDERFANGLHGIFHAAVMARFFFAG